jgi:hypothetical protein
VVEKVLKIDRPLAGRFLGLTAPSGLRVVVAAGAAVYSHLTAAAKTFTTGLAPVGNAPLLPPAAASPPEGEILAALCFVLLMR